jgi:predicted phage terminase large subunit-like protein
MNDIQHLEDTLRRIRSHIERRPADFEPYKDYFDVLRAMKDGDKQRSYEHNLWLRRQTAHMVQTGSAAVVPQFYELNKKTYLFMAQDDFHSYLIYIEWNRPVERRFYQPRMHYLKPMVRGYQDVLDGKLDLLTISQPKRTGKSQTGINFVNMLSGRNPDGSTLMEGAGAALVNSFYKGVLEYLDPKSEYLYYDVFPDAKIVATSAENKTINLKTNSRFPTIMCRSIDATQVGLSEATNLLYLDDLVESREEAKNRDRLEAKWETVSGDVLGRRIEGTPIVAAGTRYSLYDPIGRLQEYARLLGWRWRAIEIPALDPETDESNYEHIKDGRKIFTTEYLRKERLLLSEEQWESEFQQQPFEAKGLMFPESKLKRFIELPVDMDPDAVISVCDTAEDGADSVMMPVAMIYGEDVYIVDCVFDDSPPEITKPQCAKILVNYKVSTAVFESNNAGTYYARDVEKLVKGLGGTTNIRTKRTISNKHTRIEMASDGIIKHFYFKDRSLYKNTDQYGRMMKELTTYTRTGKVKHDDAPDGLSLLENEIRNLLGCKVEIAQRPW